MEGSSVVHDSSDPVILVPEDFPALAALVVGPACLVAVGVVGVGLIADVNGGMRLLLRVHVGLLVGGLLLLLPRGAAATALV